jgi:Na+-transporting NADH:ubiquinone oxidoreductase subunit C
MNTNSNTYTVIYSIILVVVVAAVLAFAAMFLKPTQEANVKKDTISQILTAATFTGVEDAQILDTYKTEIETAILVDIEGNKVGELNIEDCEVYGTADLKKQIAAEQKALPVYIFKNGITVVPCYGAGLWGPIWGYVGFEKDLNTIKAVRFGHKGETPGLGAKIADEPSFAEAFIGKTVGAGELLFEVVKPANRQTENNGVDAISGATITSQALGNTLNQWFGFYKNYFEKNAVAEVVDAVINETAELEPVAEVESTNTVEE